MKGLVFLKLGGSIITEKDQINTANLERIDRIAYEISRAQRKNPEFTLLIGHGSGSFGHVPANQSGTRNGVNTLQQWHGFVEVGNRARALNQIVIDRLLLAGVKAISFSPCSSILAQDRKILKWDTTNIETAIQNKITPVVYGDIIFDQKMGGTILSTEELFEHLSKTLNPNRILLAGLEEGVWKDFPSRTELITEITPQSYASHQEEIRSSTNTDVTGGMRSKVEEMINLVEKNPQLEVVIFSALYPENVYLTLMGNQNGTLIRNPERT